MDFKRFLYTVVFGCVFTFGVCQVAGAEEIRVGVVSDVSGPNSANGQSFLWGVEDSFQMINESGGVNGRKVDLLALDCEYKVERELAAFKRLVTQNKIIAFIGFSSGGSLAIKPVAEQYKVPQLTPSRPETMTTPYSDYVFQASATYTDEVVAMLEYIKKHPIEKGRKPRVAFAHSNIEYGMAPMKDVKDQKTAEKLDVDVVATVAIDQKATEVVSQALTLKQANPDYICMILTPGPGSVFLKDCKKAGIQSKIIGFSYCGDFSMLKLVGNDAEGMLITTPTPYVNETYLPGIKQIVEFSKKNHPKRDLSTSITASYVIGWVDALLVAEAVRLAGSNLTGEGVKNGFESIKQFTTGGLNPPVTFTKGNHKGSTEAYMYIARPAKMAFERISE